MAAADRLSTTTSEPLSVAFNTLSYPIILDHWLPLLAKGFSGKLLLPFVSKTAVQIPQRMENDYFRHFILKNVSKAEVTATGFDNDDTELQLRPQILVERSFTGEHLLVLLTVMATRTIRQTASRATHGTATGCRRKQRGWSYALLLSPLCPLLCHNFLPFTVIQYCSVFHNLEAYVGKGLMNFPIQTIFTSLVSPRCGPSG